MESGEGKSERGYPSDDTRLAFWTLEQMLQDNGLNPNHLAGRFCRERIFGIGSSVREFTGNYTSGRIPWYECGPRSAGNGVLMRIASMVFPYLKAPTAELWVDTALSAMLTHNDYASISACLAAIHLIWRLFQMEAPPAPHWWIDEYVKITGKLEIDNSYSPRGGIFKEYRGPLWRFVQDLAGRSFRPNRRPG